MDEHQRSAIEEMLDPIERLFEREYEADFGFFRSGKELAFSNGHSSQALVDLLYVASGRERLHAIRVMETYDDCLFDIHHGIHSLGESPANFRWIALPLEEFRDGEEAYSDIMLKTCKERGFGIITVQVKGRGHSAKIIASPDREEGNFLEDYQGLTELWKDRLGKDTTIDGFQVVDYYER